MKTVPEMMAESQRDLAKMLSRIEQWDRMAISWGDAARQAMEQLKRFGGAEAPAYFEHAAKLALARKEVYEDCAQQLRSDLGLGLKLPGDPT